MSRPTSVGQAVLAAASILAEAGIEEARFDAMLLLMFACNARREDLILAPERLLSENESKVFDRIIAERRLRRPLAYIVGERWFYGRPFDVNPSVLIPRPETEMIVEFAVSRATIQTAPLRIADIGTGSGCIAITVAAELPDAIVTAVDLSAAALLVAQRNACRHGVDGRITFLLGDLLEPILSQRFDLILSNPPYIIPDDVPSLMPEVAEFEPELALSHGAGADGSALHRRLILDSRRLLVDGGFLCLEVGSGQADTVCLFAEQCGYKSINKTRDLGGVDRLVTALWMEE